MAISQLSLAGWTQGVRREVLPNGLTLLVLPEARAMHDYERRLASEIEMLKNFHTEDMEVCVAVQKGMNSGAYRPGRLSHLEVPIWHIQRYLARKIREATCHAGF